MTSEESYERMEQQSAHLPTPTKKPRHEEETEQKERPRLTKKALKRHDRKKSRSKSRFLDDRNPPSRGGSLERFARGGGPDLRDLRGYPEPSSKNSPRAKPGQGRPSITPLKRQTARASAAETVGTQARPPSQFSSTASTDSTISLSLLLERANVRRPTFDRKPVNVQDWMGAIRKDPCPLGADAAISAAHRQFLWAIEKSSLKKEVMVNVFPAIRGGLRYLTAVSRICPNVADLSDDDKLIIPKPDYMEGCEMFHANMRLCAVLSPFIVTANVEEAPFAPNLFAKILGNSDSLEAAEKQARYDGAIGARGIHMMLNLGKAIEVFDGKAYTVTFIYYSGFLRMYLHFIVPTGDPEYPRCYQTARAGSWALEDLEGFRDGVTAYRNAQDLAHELREEVVRQAIAKVDQMSEDEYQALVNEAEQLKLKGRRGRTNSFDGEEATTI